MSTWAFTLPGWTIIADAFFSLIARKGKGPGRQIKLLDKNGARGPGSYDFAAPCNFRSKSSPECSGSSYLKPPSSNTVAAAGASDFSEATTLSDGRLEQSGPSTM